MIRKNMKTHVHRFSVLLVAAQSLLPFGCGVVVQPDVGTDAASDVATDDGGVTAPDVPTDVEVPDSADARPLPVNSRVIVVDSAPMPGVPDLIESMYINTPAPPSSGYWTEASGRCEVETLLQPGFSVFANRLEYRVSGVRVFPRQTADDRMEWRATADEIRTGAEVSILAENPMWTRPWTTSVVVPPRVQLSTPPPEYRVSSSEELRVAWTAPTLPSSSVVELRLLNLIPSRITGLFDFSAIRCEYPPRSGDASIRLSEHRAFRYMRSQMDNIVLMLNVVERQLVPSETGTVEVIARSESVLIPVIVRD